VLLDEADFSSDRPSREILRILRNGNCPGADTYVGRQRYRTFGPKVICSRVPLDDAALSSRAIQMTMLPTLKDLPLLDRQTEEKIARELQPKLLRFRLEHYEDVRIAEPLEMAGSSPRLRELARTLAAPISTDPEMVARLLALMRTQDDRARIDRYHEPEWAVMAALFDLCHSSHRVFIGNLAVRVDRILAEMGEEPLSAKKVGQIARASLGVRTVKIGRGYYLPLKLTCKRQIHQLAHRMGLTKADILDANTVDTGYGGFPCQLCSEFGLNTRPDFEAQLAWVAIREPHHYDR
jgi:hypothetical protein